MDVGYNVPMWRWSSTPLKGKLDMLKWVTREHVIQVSKATTPEQVIGLLEIDKTTDTFDM